MYVPYMEYRPTTAAGCSSLLRCSALYIDYNLHEHAAGSSFSPNRACFHVRVCIMCMRSPHAGGRRCMVAASGTELRGLRAASRTVVEQKQEESGLWSCKQSRDEAMPSQSIAIIQRTQINYTEFKHPQAPTNILPHHRTKFS